MTQIQKIISPLISSQFPNFYQSEGPNFIAFMEAYYEWMESQGQIINQARSLFEYTDVDTTLPTFIKFFKNTYLNSIPNSIVANPVLLLKHIKELYRSKGTLRAYKLLFRMFFNEDVEISYPSQYMFKLSDNTWNVPQYIEVSSAPYLANLISHQIISSSNSALAIVENYFTKIVNNRIIDILQLSNLEGNFKYGEQFYCPDLLDNNNNPIITDLNASTIIGSLSAISIIDGGSDFNIGDILNVYGNGDEGLAKVIRLTSENGKINFKLINGGFGYSMNAIISVAGGGGTGATFSVGGLTNKQTFQINTDIVNNYINTTLDVASQGFNFLVSNSTGNMTVGETVTTSGNAVSLDVSQIFGNIANNESLSNSSLGIANLVAYDSQGSFILATGPENQLTNANLVTGTVLISNTSSSTVSINTNFGKQVNSGNGVVVSSNSSVLAINFANGGFVPFYTIIGSTSAQTAYITSIQRNTDWLFPYATSIGVKANLDSAINLILNVETLIVGTITFINNINPGEGYSSNPTVTVVEPLIAALNINDGIGSFYGEDAVVTATAGNAKGITLAVQVIQSGFGYDSGENLLLTNANNTSAISGSAIVDLNGVLEGSWLGKQSFLSDTQVIQDSYFYQDFSYELLASRMLSTYQEFVQNLVHPSGLLMFGRFNISDTISAISSSSYNNFTQLHI